MSFDFESAHARLPVVGADGKPTTWAALQAETHSCPNCGTDCQREEADVGIGIMFGPWGCPCGWSESDEYNQLNGPTSSEGGYRTDQYGWLYPDQKVTDAPLVEPGGNP